MAVVRTFRGREIDRTKRLGDNIEIVFRNSIRGSDKDRVLVPFTEYAQEVRKDFRLASVSSFNGS